MDRANTQKSDSFQCQLKPIRANKKFIFLYICPAKLPGKRDHNNFYQIDLQIFYLLF